MPTHRVQIQHSRHPTHTVLIIHGLNSVIQGSEDITSLSRSALEISRDAVPQLPINVADYFDFLQYFVA